MALVSRAADSFMVPRVACEAPENMRLEYPFEIEGRVIAKESHAIYCMENLRVAHVEIHPNDMVQKGSLLFSIDMDDLETKIQQAEQGLKKLSMQIKDLEQAKNIQASQHSLSISRAKEDYDDISNSSGTAVDTAYRELEQAKNELALHDSQRPEETAALENIGAGTTEPDCQPHGNRDTHTAREPSSASGINPESKEHKTLTTEGELPTSSASSEESPFAVWSQKREELAQACREKEKQYEEAAAARNESLKAAARQLEDASLPVAPDSSQALLQLEQADSARTLQELKALRQAEGKVYSEYDGQILACSISIGSVTSGEPVLLLADTSQPLQFEGTFEVAGELPIEEGTAGTLTIDGQNGVLEHVQITRISQENGGICRVTAALDSYNVTKTGDAVLDISWASERYPCCIPLSALYSGEAGDFAIRVAEKPTILGLEATAEYVPVTVLEKNGRYAAVEGNLSPDDRIIVNASKTVKEGERIRVTEN